MNKLMFLFFCLITGFAYGQKQVSSPNKQAQKSYIQANQYISYKVYDKAIAELEQVVALDKNFPAAYQQLGDIYRKLGDYSKALLSYKKVLEIDPDFLPLTYFGLAESEFITLVKNLF